MIDRVQARRLVESRLEGVLKDDQLVIIDELTIERAFGWVFFYDSAKFRQTGQIDFAIAGNGPVFVNRQTGEVELHGSAKPVDAAVAEYERRHTASPP